MKLNILAFAAHPDDVELSCSGTLLLHIRKGLKAGIVDLTQGELGTRGNAEIRKQEAGNAAKFLGLSIRTNLELSDGFFENSKENQLKIVREIRKYQPDLVLANAPSDRHPDHGRASSLVSDACFLAGLSKVITEDESGKQSAWRPSNIFYYIQDRYQTPHFLVDISQVMEDKISAIKCFSSQFYDPRSTEPETPISSLEFMDFLYARAREMGRPAGIKFAEGFLTQRVPVVGDILSFK